MVAKHDEQQTKLTTEQRQGNKDMFLAMLGDPAKMEEMKAESVATFQAADADGDGLLSKAEFIDHAKKNEQNARAKGWAVPEASDEYAGWWWEKFTEIAGTPDGISYDNFMQIQGQMMAVYAQKYASQ